MKAIQRAIENNASYEVKEIKDALGFSWKELTEEIICVFLSSMKLRIPFILELRVLKRREKNRQRELYFFKNEMKRLYLQIEWQYKIYGAVEHKQVVDTINLALKRFACLPVEIQQDLSYQKERYVALLDKKTFEVQFDNIAPKMVERRK